MSRLSKVSLLFQPIVDMLFQSYSFVYRKGRAEWDDPDSLDNDCSRSLEDGSGISSGEESDPDTEMLLQQRRGKKRVLSVSN